MKNNIQFFSSLLDRIDNQIAVLDKQGIIVYVNKSWRDFSLKNGAPIDCEWVGHSYINVCNDGIDELGRNICDTSVGIRRVLKGELESFVTDYPCDSPTQRRWFTMTISVMPMGEKTYYLISHSDITERKLAEERILELSMSDPLTLLANRRHFDQHIAQEWQRGLRSGKPISVIMIDIDFFKMYNDGYGHVKGDECLCQVSQVIKKFARRPGDLAARFGGEEFILVISDIEMWQAQGFAEQLRKAIVKLKIPNINGRHLTVSIGISNTVPHMDNTPLDGVLVADKALYLAKKNGRNRVESAYTEAPKPMVAAASA